MTNNIFFLLVLSLFIAVHSQERIEIVLTNVLQKVSQSNTDLIYYTAKLPHDFSYLYFRVTSFDDDVFARLYVSAKSSTPDYDFSEYKGIDYNNTIYYPASELAGQREVTVAIECNGHCKSELEYYYIAKDGYVMVNETNTKFDVRIGESDGFFLVYNISSVNGQIPTTLLSVTSSGIEDFEPFLVYGESTENPLIKMEKMFFNGYGIVIGSGSFQVKENSALYMWVTPTNYGDVFTFEVKRLETGDEVVYPTEVITSVLGYLNMEQRCFTIRHDFTDSNGTAKDFIDYTLHGYSYTNNTKIEIRGSDGKALKSKNFGGSDYFDFQIVKGQNDTAKICVSIVDDKKRQKVGSIQFQIFDADRIEDITIQPYLMFLVRGLPIVSRLKPGTSAFFQVTTYAMNSTELQGQLRTIAGNPNLYMGISLDYPNEVIYSIDIEDHLAKDEIIPSDEVNGNYFVKLDVEGAQSYKVGDPVIAIVDCPYDVIHNSDCVFSLTLNNEMDQVVLLENVKFSTSIQNEEIQTYSFDVNATITKNVKIVLYSFSGDADLKAYMYERVAKVHFEVDSDLYYAVGNKEYYELTFEADDNEVKQFYLEVYGKTNAYYSIYYTTNDDKANHIYLEPGEITTEAIDASRTNVLHFTNRDERWSPDYIITLQAMNCFFDVSSYDGSTTPIHTQTREVKYFIEPADAHYGSEFTVTVTNVVMDTNYTNDQCLMYIASGEQDVDRVLVLNEGIHHGMRVSPSIEDIYYLYPFQPREGGDFYNELVISVRKFSEDDLSLTYFLGFDAARNISIRSYTRKVVIPVNEIVKECEDELCPVLIRVAPLKNNVTIEFEISITGATPSPIYLPISHYRYDTVKSYQRITYYTELAAHEEGEVIVDFKRGTGSALAVMYRKEDRFPDGWNRRFPIPDQYSNFLLPYDHDNKKFLIQKERTESCGLEGCIVIIVVETKNSPNEEIRSRLNEFSIFIRTEFSSAIYLPENEYVFGSLSTESGKDMDTFYVNIEKLTDKVILVFDSDFCSLSVTIFDSSLKKMGNFTINGFESGREITAEKLKIQSMQGVVLYLVTFFDDPNFKYGDDLHYSLKVVTPEKDNQRGHLIEVNANQNDFCTVVGGKGVCNFLVPVYDYYHVDFVHLFILNELNPSHKGTITATILTEEEYERGQDTFSYTAVDGNSHSSADQLNTNTLFLSLLKYEGQSVFIVVTVDSKVSDKSATITFMSSFFNAWDETSITPGTHELFRLESDTQTNMLIPGTDGYYVEVVVVSGVGVISSKNFETIILEDEGRDSAAFIIPTLIPNTLINIKADNEEELLFYVRYLSRPLKQNIDKILFGDSNYIEFAHNQLVDFPLVFYVEVTDLELMSDVALTVQFNNIDFIYAKRTLNEMFDIKIAYFNEESLKQFILGQQQFEPTTSNNYDPFFKVASAVFKDNLIKQIGGNHQYLAMHIHPHDNNGNKYINLHVNVICFAINQKIIKTGIPKREYFFSNIDAGGYQELRLTKGSPDDEYFNMQLFANLEPKLTVSCPSFKGDLATTSNVTEIKGKKFITIYDEISKDITLDFIIHNNENVPMKYVFKYETTPFPLNHSYFVVSNTKVAHTEYNQTLNLTLTSVKTSFGDIPERATYTVRIFDKSGVNINDLDMFYYDKQTPKFTYTKINEKTDDTVTMSFDVPSGKYVASVMASVDHGYESEFLQYGSFSFEIEKVNNDTNSGNVGIYIAIVICIILLAVAVVVIVQKKKGGMPSSYKQPVIDEDTIHQINSVNDSSAPEQLIP